MKTAFAVVLALAPAIAQIRPTSTQPAPAPVPAAAAKLAAAPGGSIPVTPVVSLGSLYVLQSTFDQSLGSYGYPEHPIDLLGKTRGVYLSDYGVVFTTELSPIITLPITPFHTKISDEEKKRTRQSKLERIPVIKSLMAQFMRTAATQLNLMPDEQQVVLVVRLLYLPYEDTEGLPGQIMMKGDKRSILAGRITTE